MFNSRLFIAFALLTVTGCRCGPPTTTGTRPEFDPDPKAVSFEACPTLDEAGNPVADVFPDEKKITLRNLGKSGGVAAFTLTGPDKDAFSLVSGQTPEFVEPTSEVEFPVRFSPTKKGDAKAELVIDDGDPETETASVALIGSGRTLPAQPTLEVALENKDVPTQYDACFTGGTCLQLFPDTFYQQSATLTVKLKNTGCPALKITGMEMAPLGTTAGNLAFFLDEPAIPPTQATPLLLTTADGQAETTVKVRFAPENDGSGSTQRYALLKVFTNDPVTPQYDIQLAGNASEPAIYSQPTFCDFSLPSDLCGYPTKQANQARFEVKNGGNVAITISEVSLANGGQGRFTITQNVLNKTINPGSSEFLEVSHTDAPVYVTELLTLQATANGNSAGSAIITLAGGVKPCLTTDPLDQLDFQNPAEETSSKQVMIRNGAGCGDLVISNVVLDPTAFFTVVDPKIPAGHVIAANTSAIATIQYKKPVSGGTQTGVLRIHSNDPDYGPPPHKVVRIYSESPLDQLPIAVLEGCKSNGTDCAENTMTVALSTLNPKALQLNGNKSYDPPATQLPANSKYLFRLVKKPLNATAATLENDGQKVGTATAKLTLDPLATGLYQVTLTVFDDKNQPSASASEIKISVTQ